MPKNPIDELDIFTHAWDQSGEDGQCMCVGCRSMRDRDDEPTENDTTASPGIVSAVPSATLDEMADYLEVGYWGNGSSRQHNVGSTGLDPNNGVLLYNLSGHSRDDDGVTAERAALIRDALDVYQAVLGIEFQETTSTDTNVVDFFFADDGNGAYASSGTYWDGTIRYSNINIAAGWSGGTSNFDDYTLQTIFHELGHALGLGHQGDYNGSARYSNDAIFELDSWQATMMSYFSQNENSAVNANYEHLQTPMAVDWIALDRMYGQFGYGISNAFRGDTVYGFNTNISEETSRIWHEFSDYANRTASTIVDGEGVDTLDFSGYSANQKIDLTVQTADQNYQDTSNIGGRTGNLTLAIGTVIENAVGGSGNDQIIGNDADNLLIGGAGNDRLTGFGGDDVFQGDAGSDTVVFSSAFGSYAFSILGETIEVIGEGFDYVYNSIEMLEFSDLTLGFAALFQTIENNKLSANDDAVRVQEGGTSSIDVLSNDVDIDLDNITLVSLNGIAISAGGSVTLASGAIVRLANNGTLSFIQNGVYDGLDSGETAVETIDYTATDGTSYSSAKVTITIDGNSPPQATNDSFVTKAGPTITIDVLKNDKDNDDDPFDLIALNGVNLNPGDTFVLASGARLTLNQNGSLTYDQRGAFADLTGNETAEENFTYSISDGDNIDEATVTLTIQGNTRPDAKDDAYRVGESTAIELDLLANDRDADGDTFSIIAVDGRAISVGGKVRLDSGAEVTLNADGTLTYDQRDAFRSLDNWETEADVFSYSVTDGLLEANATVAITIDGYDKPSESYSGWHIGSNGSDWVASSVVRNTKVFGGNGDDDLLGGAGDTADILAGGAGRDWLWGLGGDDILLGNQGADRLFGGDGSDGLYGGTGDDRLMGGAGADRFVFESGGDRDIILDFENGIDQIVIDVVGYDTFDDLRSKMSQTGSSVDIDLAGGNQIEVLNSSIGAFAADDFIFV